MEDNAAPLVVSAMLTLYLYIVIPLIHVLHAPAALLNVRNRANEALSKAGCVLLTC